MAAIRSEEQKKIDRIIGNNLYKLRTNKMLTQTELGKELNMAQNSVGLYEKGANSIPIDRLSAIADYFNVSVDFLSTNINDVLSNEAGTKSHPDIAIPYYDIEISAGPITFYQDYKEMPSQKIEIPFIKDVDLAMPVYGDSMYPKIKNGDIVLLKEVDKALIMFGEIYLVITNDYRVLKYVRKHISREHVTLLSENDRFDPVEITKDEILHIFLYKGKFEKSQI